MNAKLEELAALFPNDPAFELFIETNGPNFDVSLQAIPEAAVRRLADTCQVAFAMNAILERDALRAEREQWEREKFALQEFLKQAQLEIRTLRERAQE